VKTGFGFAKLAGFTGFPVLAKTGFHSLLATRASDQPFTVSFLENMCPEYSVLSYKAGTIYNRLLKNWHFLYFLKLMQ